MRVLVVGYGSMGRRHAANAEALGHKVSVFDENSTDEGWTSLGKGLEWSPSAVVLATPASEHWSGHVAVGTLPMLIEKPLGLTARLPWSRWHTNSLVGYNLRYHPATRVLHERLRSFGIVSTASFYVRCDKSTWPGKSYEDMLLEASHEIDLATFLLGAAECVGARSLGRDVWSLLLQHRTGVLTSVVLDGTYKGYWRGCEIVGPNGALRSSWQDQALEWRWTVDAPGYEQARGHCSPDQTYKAEMSDFLHGVEHGRPHAGCSVAEAYAVLEICDKARELAG